MFKSEPEPPSAELFCFGINPVCRFITDYVFRGRGGDSILPTNIRFCCCLGWGGSCFYNHRGKQWYARIYCHLLSVSDFFSFFSITFLLLRNSSFLVGWWVVSYGRGLPISWTHHTVTLIMIANDSEMKSARSGARYHASVNVKDNFQKEKFLFKYLQLSTPILHWITRWWGEH